MMNWISVEDELPEHAEDVLVFTKNETYSLGHYFYGDGWSLEEDTIVTDYVTHWMPLPSPPEEGE